MTKLTDTYNNTSPFCNICGKPYVYVGDVPSGGFPIGGEPYCTCLKVQPFDKHFKFCPHCGEKL